MIPAGRIAEVLRQFAFVSAVLGGFGFAYIGALLTTARDDRAASWAAGVAVAASVVLVLTTIAATFGAIYISMNAATEYPAPPGPVGALWPLLTVGLFVGPLLLFVSLGMSGFVRSRRTGYVTAAAAVVGALGLGLLVALF